MATQSLASWNLACGALLPAVAAEPVDVALLQEVEPPPAGRLIQLILGSDGGPWRTDGWKNVRGAQR